MQLTKHTDISLRVLMHLAFADKLVTAREIAVRYNVSRNHVVKVVHRLSGFGYVQSVRGRGGGVVLAHAPDDIVVGQVVRDMEATLEVIDCAKNDCPLTGGCLLKGALNQATRAFLDALDRYTVADLIRNRDNIIRLVGT